MAIKQYVSLNEPLCGIGTYKDTLNLDTGATVRQIKKLVLTGTEYVSYTTVSGLNCFLVYANKSVGRTSLLCSHYRVKQVNENYVVYFSSIDTGQLIFYDNRFTTAEDFKTYLQQQYAADTPVTVWSVLATPTTSTTALPRGLSGVVEGSLTQSGTPTPTNPIYPTANSINSFLDKKYLKYGTETDTITTLPKTIIGDGQSASAVIKGNMQQSGTPTPTNPIYPQETGDKTANLFDKNATNTSNGYISGSYLDSSGNVGNSSVNIVSEYIDISGLSNITISNGYEQSNVYNCFYDANKDFISSFNNGVMPRVATVPANAKYIRLTVRGSVLNNLMLNSGSTSLPYEPYGYKIPISSANTTTPVYLGEVQSTRRIKQLVLTGQEKWVKDKGNTYASNISSISGYYNSMCSHYVASYSYLDVIATNNRYVTGETILFIHDDNYSTAENFKSYLAQQYAAGTPVTVWYVLSTATTGIVNEPIRKIGNYADSVTGTGLPTTGTAETFDVDTTLKPSEVSLTYQGWHEHSDTVFSSP